MICELGGAVIFKLRLAELCPSEEEASWIVSFNEAGMFLYHVVQDM